MGNGVINGRKCDLAMLPAILDACLASSSAWAEHRRLHTPGVGRVVG